MKGVFIFFSVFLVLMIGLGGCERKTSPANPNVPPNTTLANIPVEGDTLFALVTLHWDGEDDDGYIAGYEYRYITHHLFRGDSVVTPWVRTEATSVTIPFESSDSLNYQTFQVRAVDNAGDVDPTPAERHFYTYQTIHPVTEILFPQDEQQFFIIEQVTDWWPGIQLRFTARDEDGEVVEYAWRVDEGDWNWTTDTSVYITPEHFQPLDGWHVLRVTSRDNTNLLDDVGDSVKILLIQPTFEKDILIIDETDEGLFPIPLRYQYSDADVDSFYAEIFQTRDQWDYFKKGMPPKTLLGQYKLVIWHADNLYSNENDVHRLPRHIEDIMDYLNVGGDFIMGGWRILKSFAPADPFPKYFDEGTFIHDYLHILQADETPLVPGDLTVALGSSGFSDIRVDSIKLSEAFPFLGKLAQVNVMPRRAGFTDVIYRYGNDPDGLTFPRGLPIGLRYYGTSFDVIVFGFPMFFIRKEDAHVMAREVLHSLGYTLPGQ
ncbi:MAG: hypothetical protein GXO78_11825 [Calditrichaeota bacterium]|nr:hypothetical protein [Calditrichota bacterium]